MEASKYGSKQASKYDGKSEIMTDSLTGWPTDSPNYKEMLSHLKKRFHFSNTILIISFTLSWFVMNRGVTS